MARLKEIYRKEIAPKLKEELKLSNVMEVPRVTKITLNMGLGEAIGDNWAPRCRSIVSTCSSTLLLTWKRSPARKSL